MTIMPSQPSPTPVPGGPLQPILLWLRRHLGRFHAALAALATLGFLGALFAFGVFAIFALTVARGMTQATDEAVLRWFEARRSPAGDFIMTEATTLGNISVLAMLIITAALVLWATGHRWSVLLLLLGGVGGVSINSALKEWFDRARPEVVEAIAHVASPSFPSGHAMNSLIVYGSLAYVVARLGPTRLLRHATWAGAALMIAVIGTSRVYLGVHYPSDVIAGFLAGAGWLVLLPAAVAVLQYFHPGREQRPVPAAAPSSR
jgi:undecaprenyl-diphosphatase